MIDHPNGGLSHDAIDAKIEAWHAGEGEGLELHEYLGWTWEEYKHWIRSL